MTFSQDDAYTSVRCLITGSCCETNTPFVLATSVWVSVFSAIDRPVCYRAELADSRTGSVVDRLSRRRRPWFDGAASRQLGMDQVMSNMTNPATEQSRELDADERQIAAKYMRIVPWGAVIWAFSNLAIWIALWPLVLYDIMPLWLGFIIASINVSLCYLPSHEAQHSIIARRGQPLRWLNELVGHLSVIPLVQPYRVLRHTHMEHHAHTNDAKLDPDYSVHAPGDFAFLLQSIKTRQPASNTIGAYADALQRTGKEHVLIDALVYNLLFLTFLVAMAWSGYALEAALLWWLPRHVGLTYIQYYLSWAPHHPGNSQGRYRDTRAFKSRLGNLLSLGMQYHIVHHLYPHIPLSKTPAAYRELKPILQQRGCDLGNL